MDDKKNFADVRLAWNELGLGVQVEVRGKQKPPQGDAARPRGSDGVTLWLDMRDARTSHRGSRYCHQFHLLAAGGGPDRDEPALAQTKINRALEDAPFAPSQSVVVAAHVEGEAGMTWKRFCRPPPSTASIRSSIRGWGSTTRCATKSWANRR